jgi:hypothetical protein
MTVVMPQRFRKGEVFCYVSSFDSALPVCAKDETGRFIRLHENPGNWLDQGHELFHKIPKYTLCYGFVCEYDPMCLVVHAGSEWSESEQHAFFGILFVNSHPHMIRIEDNDPHLWKVIDPEQELIQNYKGDIMTPSKALHYAMAQLHPA